MSQPPTEHQEQAAFVKWFRSQFPKVRIFAVPNAAKRSPQLAAYMKAEGMSPGCPDLWIPEWKMAIEMKRSKGGALTQEQAEWGEYLHLIGWNWRVCNGFDAARRIAIDAARRIAIIHWAA